MHSARYHPSVMPGVDLLSIISDRSFPRHTHDEFGFGLIVDGGQESWSGRGLVEARAGDIITVNPGELHDGLGRTGETRSWHMVYITPTALPSLTDRRLDAVEFEQPVLARSEVTMAVAQAIRVCHSEPQDSERAEQALMLALDAMLGGPISEQPAGTPAHSCGVSRALEHIHDASSQQVSLDALASAADMSRFHLLRVFKKEVGTTPHAYLTQQRVKRAKTMIAGGCALAETAIACGFADQSHMTRAFVRQLGVSPGKLLQKAR